MKKLGSLLLVFILLLTLPLSVFAQDNSVVTDLMSGIKVTSYKEELVYVQVTSGTADLPNLDTANVAGVKAAFDLGSSDALTEALPGEAVVKGQCNIYAPVIQSDDYPVKIVATDVPKDVVAVLYRNGENWEVAGTKKYGETTVTMTGIQNLNNATFVFIVDPVNVNLKVSGETSPKLSGISTYTATYDYLPYGCSISWGSSESGISLGAGNSTVVTWTKSGEQSVTATMKDASGAAVVTDTLKVTVTEEEGIIIRVVNAVKKAANTVINFFRNLFK